jgi:hypothetical protein
MPIKGHHRMWPEVCMTVSPTKTSQFYQIYDALSTCADELRQSNNHIRNINT